MPELFSILFSGPYRFEAVHFFWRPMLSALFSKQTLKTLLENKSESVRAQFIDHVSSCCLTTSVYDHLFLEDDSQGDRQSDPLNLADGYSVASEKLAQIYNRRFEFNQPSAVIPDGVDLERFNPRELEQNSDARRRVIIGWAGNSGWGIEEQDHKGLNTIIRPAIARLKEEGLDIEGNFCDRVESWRPKELMPDYYRSLDVYVCASLHEGTPNPVLEAMACGIPVLSTDVGIVRDAFGPLQQSFIVSDRNSPEFINRLRRLVVEPELRARLAVENLESIRGWSWSQQAAKWRRFFDSTYSNHAESGTVSRKQGHMRAQLAAGDE